MRISWIDQLKAFTIFAVVAGHIMSCGTFDSSIGNWTYGNLIVPFHMPLFAILSGWFFSVKDNWLSFLHKRTIGIVLPYLVWGVVWFFLLPLIKLVISGQSLHPSSIVWQIKYLVNDGLCHYAWWFLRGLFVSYVFAYLSVRLCRNNYLIAGLGSSILLYGLCFCGIIPNMPSKDDFFKGFVYLYPFFWTGVLLRRKESFIDANLNKIMIVSSLLFFGMLLIWNSSDAFYSMNTSAVAINSVDGIVGEKVVFRTILRYIIGVVGSICFISIFKKLPNSDLVVNIGQETLGIYILQSLVYWSLPGYSIIHFGSIGNFVFALIVSLAIVILSYYIIILTSRNKYLRLFCWGKRK